MIGAKVCPPPLAEFSMSRETHSSHHEIRRTCCERFCKFAARLGEKSNLCTYNFVKNMFIQAMHAMVGAGGTNSGAQFVREMSMAIVPEREDRGHEHGPR